MKRPLTAVHFLAFALRAVAQPAPAQAPGKPSEQADYFAKVVGYAQRLLAQHVNPPPLPRPLPNPFREPGFVDPEAIASAGGDLPVPVLSGSALLNKLTAELRVSGMVTIGERRALVINGTPRREGETITVKSGAATYYLLFKTLGNGTAVFSMDGAESTIRFRVN
jgi:hypothetical protein